MGNLFFGQPTINSMRFFGILFLVLFLLPLNAKAVGVSVNPSDLDIILPSVTNSHLNIKNISTEPIAVSVYSDDFSEQITIVPNELRLLPDEIGQVKVITNFDNQAKGVKKTNISVVAKAVNKRSFNAASGLKIPLTIHIGEKYWHWTAATVFGTFFVGLLLIGFTIELIFLILRSRHKKRHIFGHNFLHHHKKRWWK
jgi:hypothetical protein